METTLHIALILLAVWLAATDRRNATASLGLDGLNRYDG